MDLVKNPARWLVAMSLALVATLSQVNPASAGFYSVEEVHPIWVKVDINRDGYLSRLEVRAEDAELLRGFDEADIDCDGKLNLGEFELLLISL